MTIRPLLVAALALLLAVPPAIAEGSFGHYIGKFVAEFGDDGRKVTLMEPYSYVDPLTREIAKRNGVSEENVLMGCGSTEFLQIAPWTFLRKGGRLVLAKPTYSWCAGVARVMEREVTEVPLAPGRQCPLEARPAVEALAVPLRAAELAPPAGLPVGDADLCRREARQDPEGDGEGIRVMEPGEAAEESHAGPGEGGVREDQAAEMSRDAAPRVDQLDPREAEKQRHRRPGAEPRRIAALRGR